MRQLTLQEVSIEDFKNDDDFIVEILSDEVAENFARELISRLSPVSIFRNVLSS
ncbi:hypothetical protein [Fusobacterium sp. PH5-44]|uniref:hypothetical protein n=1 Tax=unclassified Fusobacterium TaxID=2648384 RepID=UPI003D21A22B